jgi:hypothetical protein
MKLKGRSSIELAKPKQPLFTAKNIISAEETEVFKKLMEAADKART